MKIGGSRRCHVMALVLVSVLGLTMAASGHAASAPADPDPETLSRLRWAETPGGEALLVGTDIEVGAERPERVFLPVILFANDAARAVAVRELTVKGSDGKVRASTRPGKRLAGVQDLAESRADVLARLADRDQERAVGLARRGFAAFKDGIPVSDLELTDGTTTTFTVRATLDVGGTEETIILPLEVTIAALPTQTYWHGGDGHVHSSTWSDGGFTLDSQVSAAKNDGQKFIIMTDHWGGIWKVANRGNANWALYHDDCTAKQNAHGIPVLPGVEIKTAAGKGHALGYALSRSTVPPREEYWTPQELITKINAHTSGTSYAVIPHPYGGGSGFYGWGDWTATGFRAIELMSNERQASASTQSKWFELLRGNIPGVIGGGRFAVGTAGTDTHLLARPGGNGMNWVRSTTSPLTRTAVWDAVRLGRVSASGRKDLGFFTLNSAQQGSVVIADSTTTLTFSMTQKPVTGRKCTEISIRDKNNGVVWSVSNPTSTTYTKSITAPSSDTFYVVKMVFAKTDNSDYSHVWCNPVFVDRR